jgi:hypothetical protein
MANETQTLKQRLEVGRADSRAHRETGEERRRERREAHLARLQKRHDSEKRPAAKAVLAEMLERRRKHLERSAERVAARKARRAQRVADLKARRAERGGREGNVPAAPATPMNAADTIAAVATMDADALAAARASEEARDKPRTTVLAAIEAREAELAG